MSNYSRRDIIRFSSVGISIIASGCLERLDTSVELCKIDIYSTTNKMADIHLKVINGEDTIYNKIYEMKTSEEYMDGITIQGSEIPSSTGKLTVKSKLDSGEWNEWYLPEYSNDSISVYLKIQGDPPEVNFSYFVSENC
ncbi:hypothetical protein [Natrinema hispanicum]|nr:hypothetical protein [Natrinema hispanicum]